jgi:ATP-dependent DNA ligase
MLADKSRRQELDLEGIVAKRKADSYSSQAIWYKVKNPAYTQSEERWELLDRKRR